MATITGTSGNDSLVGTAADDGISGLAGNDTLLGGSGTDRAIFSGNRADYVIAFNPATNLFTVTDTVAGRDGVDTLFAVEKMQFADVTIATGMISVDPRGTYLTAAPTDAINSPTTVLLSDLGLAPGDVITLSRSGGYQAGAAPTFSDGSTSMVAVFSNAGGLVTPETYSDFITPVQGIPPNLPTNVVQDFFVVGSGVTVIKIPVGATSIKFSPADSYFQDNTDPNGDYSVMVRKLDGSTSFANSDVINGTAGADSILGLGGSDFITGGAGNDTLDGGVVTDLINYLDLNTVSYSGATAAVTINMSGITGTGSTGSGTATGDASVGTDILSNFNFIQGSAFDDTITGSAANWFEEIEGGAGNDILDGGVIAGNASNRVNYRNTTGAGVVVDFIAGSAVGQAGANAGSDTLVNFDFVTGSNFADTLLGSNRTDRGETFEGRDGNDSIDGKGGFDTIRFGSAFGGGVTVSLVTGTSSGAGVGNDTFVNIEGVRGSNFNDTITGDAFNNNLDGQGGDDSILGGGGSDSLIGLGGNDTMDGGLILDRVNYTDLNLTFYSGAAAGVNINLTGITGDGSVGSGTVTGDASVGTDVIKNINYLGGSNFNDTITGSSAVIFEIFEPGSGNDTVDGGVITDTLNSDNSNRVTYQSIAGAGVTVDFIAGTAVGAAGSNAGNDTLSNISGVQGSSFADTLLGSNRTDVFENFEGRDGNDSIDGRGGFDLVRFDAATGSLVVNLVTGTASGAGVGSDVFVNVEGVIGSGANDSITGGNAANGVTVNDGLKEFFQGNAGNDTIDGGQGYDIVYFGRATTGAVVVLNDTLDGSASDGQGGTDVLRNIEGVLGSAFNDSMTGSNTAAFESFEGRIGNDTINGLGGRDRVEYFYSRAGVNVNLATGVATDGEGTTDTLLNIEDVRGSRDFNDTITGSSSQNRFEGLGGNDTMSGAGGRDTSIYAGTAASATRTHNPDGTWTIVSATEGTDTLRNVETLQFSDRKVVIEDPQTDFNADGNSDLLWFRQSDGYAYLWTLNNNVQSGGNAIGQIGGDWTVQTTGDFNGDGSSDFVWKNTVSGQFYLWNFTNGIQSGGSNIGVIGTNWNVMGSGDFNADGTGDIVWRDSNTGQLYLWMMQNNAIASSTNLGSIGVDWTVQAFGDFNGDGTSDLALRNTATGQAYLWNFTNGTLSGGNNLGNIPTNWTIMGSGDFNADGTDDLAWRNSADGKLILWMMQNNSISSTSDLGTIGNQWTIDAISDVNADGTSDLLLKNSTSGQFYIWDITNGVVSGGADLGLIGADWQLV